MKLSLTKTQTILGIVATIAVMTTGVAGFLWKTHNVINSIPSKSDLQQISAKEEEHHRETTKQIAELRGQIQTVIKIITHDRRDRQIAEAGEPNEKVISYQYFDPFVFGDGMRNP